MLRRRIEKLEAHLPPPPDRLLEQLNRQALRSLSARDRELLNTPRSHKSWSAEHRAAEDRFLESYGVLLREISDGELAGLIEQFERLLGYPLSQLEAVA